MNHTAYLNTIRKSLDEGLQTDVIFSDIKKACDKITTLNCYTDFSNLVSLIRSYEGSRMINFAAASEELSTVRVLRVPRCQSHLEFHKVHYLAPFLFSVQINDLPN